MGGLQFQALPREVNDAPDDDDDRASSSSGDDAAAASSDAMPSIAAPEADLDMPLTHLDLSEVTNACSSQSIHHLSGCFSKPFLTQCILAPTA